MFLSQNMLIKFVLNVVTLLLAFIHLSTTDELVTVQIPDGSLQGRIVQTSTNVSYYSFYSIPYAQPPIGNLRFQPPKVVEPWDGVVDARWFKYICYQSTFDNDQENEDCLVVNVFSPNISNTADLPVMAFIHGGAFVAGSGWVGPEFFVEQGVVLVGINYRLGPFGFASTEDLVIPGNNGLKDQNLALKWIQNNIQYFGGDPKKVTIFGQSAGSASVSYHLLSPKSAGLFRAAICQSGSSLTAWAYQRRQKKYTYATAKAIDSSFSDDSNSTQLLDFLVSASAKELDAASYQVFVSEGTVDDLEVLQGFYYAPVIEVEHDDAFITKPQYEAFESGNFNQVPLIIGMNSEESLNQYGDGLMWVLKSFEADKTLLVPHDLHLDSTNENLTVVAKLIDDYYAIFADKTYDVEQAAGIRYYSDNFVVKSVIKQAELQSKYTNVYFYRFSYDGLMGDYNRTLAGTGNVTHSEELNYIFSTTLTNSQLDNTDPTKFPASDVITQRRLVKFWSNFAKDLNPTLREEELFQGILWPKVDVQGNNTFHYLDIDTDLWLYTNPRGDVPEFWDGIYTNYGIRPFDTY